jgi:hypothetical protein
MTGRIGRGPSLWSAAALFFVLTIVPASSNDAVPPTAAPRSPVVPASPPAAAPGPEEPKAPVRPEPAPPTEPATQSPETTVSPKRPDPPPAAGVLGRDVRGPHDEDMGKVIDVLVDKEGRPTAAVIDFGGFLGVGSRKVAVSWEALKFDPSAPDTPVRIALGRTDVQAAPEYKPSAPAPEIVGRPPVPAAPPTPADPPAPTGAPAPADPPPPANAPGPRN